MVQVVSKLSGLLVLTMLLFATALSGTGAAVPVDGTGNDPITVRQGGECYRPTPLGNGSEAVGSFYDYRVSTNYSSTGTIRFQEHQVSNLFVYNGSDGYSLVFLHDAYEDGAPYGSTVTFEITGLPAAGSWPVEDDDYPDQDDNFTHDGSRSEIDWMWAPERTDGAAFRGLATEPNASITVDPRFNERADEWGDWTWSGNRNNVVTEWRLLGENATEVTTLDMNRNVTVSVGPCDRTAPTASLLADETNATVGASITFDAGNSTDNEGIVTYRWDYDGDGTVDDRTDTATTTHAYANASEYNATVTVVDEAGNADSATATVGVTTAANTEAPSATLDTPSQAASGAGITLDASNSTDDEGIARYRWDYDADGTVDRRTTAATVTTSYDRLGEYNVTVTVVDGANNTDSATATITVTEPADTEAPSALLDAPNQTVVGTTVTLDASNSTDDEGIVQYRWDYNGDGTADERTDTATIDHTYTNVSTSNATVTVVDGANNTDSATATLTVTEAPDTDPPAAALDVPTETVIGAPVTLDASNSTDTEGIAQYRWDVDGSDTVDQRTESATVTAAYNTTGTVSPIVTVVDGANNTDSATATLTVTEAPDTESPTAALNAPNQTVVGTTVTLDANNATDDKGIVQYRWDYDGDGTADERTDTATIDHTYTNVSTSNATVTVVDAANNTDSAAATLTVIEPADTEAPTAALRAPGQAPVGETITLDASNATDDEGIVQYRWDYDGDGAVDNTTSAATTTIGFENASEYTPSVTVVDGAGNEDSANASLAVQPADTEPPTATLDVPSEVTVGETFTAEANNVTDANSIVKRRWYYDGTEGRNGPTRISFAERGDHTVSLELRDAVGNNRTITRTVSATADGSDRQQPADGGSNDRSGSPGGSTGPSNPGGQDATPPAAPSPPPADTAPGDESEPTDEPDTATPSLSVSSIRADNRTVAPGEPVTVTVVVTNAGDATGSYTATLTTAGSTRTDSMSVNDTVTVPAGENRSLALSTAFDRPGEYDLQAGNSTLGVVVNETTELSPPDQPDRSPSETPDGTPGETPPPPTETPPPPTETPVLTPGPTPPEPQAGNSTPTPGETSTDTTTGGPTEPLPDTPTSQTPGTDGPGFGFFSAIVSIILAALVRSRRR